MIVDAVFSITLWICVLTGMLALLWWELRNGKIPAYVGIPAQRSSKPYLFWSQLLGQVFATLIVCLITGAVIVAATSVPH